MDRKSWLWKRRSAEKTLPADKLHNPLGRKNQNVAKEAAEVMELKGDLRISHAEHSQCNNKDDMLKKRSEIAHEAVEGWESARKEAISLKNALQRKTDYGERVNQLEAALKECTQQLQFVRDEQEKRIHDAVVKTSEDFEKQRADSEQKLAKLNSENTKMRISMLEKDKVIEELNRQSARMEEDLKALVSIVQSSEKENASLKYEVCVLGKEKEIRNEERQFNRRMAGVAERKQHESDKKIARLEIECQKLRVLVKKRLPSSADLVKMKKEVENQGKNQVDNRQRRKNRLNPMAEEENKNLKNELEKKSGEAKKSSKGHINKDRIAYPISLQQNQRDDDEVSCAESWASAYLSELEQFKVRKYFSTPSHGNITTLEISLLDDFAEMEKLAGVSLDYERSHHSSDEGNDAACVGSSGMISNKKNNAPKHRNASEPIRKILELLEGIMNTASQENKGLEIKNGSDNSKGYVVKVLQWKEAQLSNVLQLLVQTCNNLLNGKGDFEQFVQVVASSLEWIANHCFSIQDVSTMKDRITSRLDWDEAISGAEIDHSLTNHSAEGSQLISVPYVSMVSPLSGRSTTKACNEDRNETQIENLKSRMRSMRLQTADQTKDQTMIKQDNDTHHSEEVREDILNLEEENRSSSDKIVEQTDIHPTKETKEDADEGKRRVKELQSQGWEITASSTKLADCQENLRNLGMLKVKALLSSAEEAALLDEVMPTTADSAPKTSISERFPLLLDKMAEEEDDNIDSTLSPNAAIYSSNEMDGGADRVAGSSLDIAPLKNKKNGTVSFLKQLLLRRKKGNSSSRKLLLS